MEDLWKRKKLGYRLDDISDRAEYNLMVRRFQDEEKSANLKNLLYGEQKLDKKKQ